LRRPITDLTVPISNRISSAAAAVDDIAGAMPQAAKKWAALPMGPGLANRYPPQPYMDYDTFLATYKAAGGSTK
jgi:hypothetical protein